MQFTPQSSSARSNCKNQLVLCLKLLRSLASSLPLSLFLPSFTVYVWSVYVSLFCVWLFVCFLGGGRNSTSWINHLIRNHCLRIYCPPAVKHSPASHIWGKYQWDTEKQCWKQLLWSKQTFSFDNKHSHSIFIWFKTSNWPLLLQKKDYLIGESFQENHTYALRSVVTCVDWPSRYCSNSYRHHPMPYNIKCKHHSMTLKVSWFFLTSHLDSFDFYLIPQSIWTIYWPQHILALFQPQYFVHIVVCLDCTLSYQPLI